MTGDGNRYRTILKHIRDGVYTLDASGEITWVNETAVENFETGYTRDDLVGSPVSKVLTDEDLEKCLSIIRTLLKNDNKESGRCEIMLQTASGEGIPCDLHLALLPAEDGEFRGTVGVLREMTERKHREQRLKVLNRILRHNLSNAMTVILGRAEQLEEDIDGQHQSMVTAIRERGEELMEISRKARQIQRITSTPPGEDISLELVGPVERILADFRENYPAVDFEVEVPAEAYAATGNEELVRTALSNLLENAIEHNNADHPFVSVSMQVADDCIRLRVEDNGPGLPSIEREVLQTGSESQLKHSMGLGLWIVAWSVTALDGDFQFEESSAMGTAVTIELPKAPTPSD